jgi:DNA polymerase kappa
MCGRDSPRSPGRASILCSHLTLISNETTNESSVMTTTDKLNKAQDHSVEATGHDDARQTNNEGVAQEPPQHASQHHSLKHSLLGPSLTKAGQDAVDQKKVSEIIYEASKGSKFFNREETRDKNLTIKIDRILKLKAQLEKLDLRSDLRRADEYIASLELTRDLSQIVVHVDCDAFYAAVEEIDRPELRDVPFAVGIGVLTTCNYHARKFGCRSAMAGFVAKKLCPELICLPQNFAKYTAKAKEVRAILAEYDPRFESASLDEAYMNITEYCTKNNMDPEAAVGQMRREIHEKCGITVSAGIAANAKVAKICSNKNKPNGQFRVPNDRAAIMSFMNTLPVRKVNGVGRVFERELDAVGVRICGEIYAQRAYLARMFGEKAFQFLMQTYLGMGRTEVRPADEYERKSVGTESTFRDMSNRVDLREKLRHTAEELEKDMARVGVKGRTLVLKIKLHTYEVFTRQVTPPKAICLADDLYNYSLPMLAKYEKEIPNMKLRLMGLRCTHLVSTEKYSGDFFGPRSSSHSKRREDVNSGEGEWEIWPDAEFEDAARQERQDEIDEMERLSQEHEGAQSITTGPDFHEPFGRYKYGSLPNSPAKAAEAPKEQVQFWDCPICSLPQLANDKAFNDHIDICLSRQTIKDAVADAAVSGGGEFEAEITSRPRSAAGKRKAAVDTGDDKRQKRLFFA